MRPPEQWRPVRSRFNRPVVGLKLADWSLLVLHTDPRTGIHEIKFVYRKGYSGDWETDKAYIKFITLVGSLPGGVR